MSACNKHPLTVPGYSGTHKRLAQAIGNMRYDKTAEVLHALHEDIARQAAADRERGRTKLASQLEQCAAALGNACQYIDAAYKTCEPHMKPMESPSSFQLEPIIKDVDGPRYEINE